MHHQVLQAAPEVLITGFEPHLTVPTRNDPSRVDLYFAIVVKGAEARVASQCFTSLSDRCRSVQQLTLEVVPFTPERGWIVARGAARNAAGSDVLHAHVRNLVAGVNEHLRSSVTGTESTVVPKVEKRPISLTHLAGLLSSFRIAVDKAPEAPRATPLRTGIDNAPVLAGRRSGEYNQNSAATTRAAESVA